MGVGKISARHPQTVAVRQALFVRKVCHIMALFRTGAIKNACRCCAVDAGAPKNAETEKRSATNAALHEKDFVC